MVYVGCLKSINRNIVECKDPCGHCDLSHIYCINRNIVECKEEDIFVQLIGNLRINRNIVECKVYLILQTTERISHVLIETLWNVKKTDILAGKITFRQY